MKLRQEAESPARYPDFQRGRRMWRRDAVARNDWRKLSLPNGCSSLARIRGSRASKVCRNFCWAACVKASRMVGSLVVIGSGLRRVDRRGKCSWARRRTAASVRAVSGTSGGARSTGRHGPNSRRGRGEEATGPCCSWGRATWQVKGLVCWRRGSKARGQDERLTKRLCKVRA